MIGVVDLAGVPKISADAHVDEPHDLWFDRMQRRWRDRAPRHIRADEDGGWSLVVDGDPIGWLGLTAEQAARNDAERLAAVAPSARIEMMRIDGLNGEIVYPTIGLYVWNITDGDAGRDACRVYNDWIRERMGGHQRVKVAAMIPTWDVDMAVEEIERASEADFAGLLLPLVGTPEWNMPGWERMWDAAASSGRPVVMHQGTGHDMIFYRGWGSPTANLLATQSMAPRATALLACSGVLERHPSMHVVLVEVNAGWMAWAMSTLDEYYLAHRHWSKPTLPELPSHYIRAQVHATFQADPVAIHNLRLTGARCLLWGNDYPHPETTFPASGQVLDDLLADVADDDGARIVGRNAAELFGFAPEVLATSP